MYQTDEDLKSIDEKINCTVNEMLHGIEQDNIRRLKNEYIKDEFGESFINNTTDNTDRVQIIKAIIGYLELLLEDYND